MSISIYFYLQFLFLTILNGFACQTPNPSGSVRIDGGDVEVPSGKLVHSGVSQVSEAYQFKKHL